MSTTSTSETISTMVVSLLAVGSPGSAGGGSSGLSIDDDPILTFGLPVSLSRRRHSGVIRRIILMQL